jgi:hypothetical protein
VWRRKKEGKENQIFAILRKRKHISGVFSTKTFVESSDGWQSLMNIATHLDICNFVLQVVE